MREITKEIIESFHDYLINEEKAQATIHKYLHDISEFRLWLGTAELCKTAVVAYKSNLCEHYRKVHVPHAGTPG